MKFSTAAATSLLAISSLAVALPPTESRSRVSTGVKEATVGGIARGSAESARISVKQPQRRSRNHARGYGSNDSGSDGHRGPNRGVEGTRRVKSDRCIERNKVRMAARKAALAKRDVGSGSDDDSMVRYAGDSESDNGQLWKRGNSDSEGCDGEYEEHHLYAGFSSDNN